MIVAALGDLIPENDSKDERIGVENYKHRPVAQ
jgi:hypothetical protein